MLPANSAPSSSRIVSPGCADSSLQPVMGRPSRDGVFRWQPEGRSQRELYNSRHFVQFRWKFMTSCIALPLLAFCKHREQQWTRRSYGVYPRLCPLVARDTVANHKRVHRVSMAYARVTSPRNARETTTSNRQTGTPVRRSTSARVTTVAISSTATSGGLPRGCTPQTAVVDEWSSAPLQRTRP